jgi:hypothetical protein
MKCRCGCDKEAQYLVSGNDFDPSRPKNKGRAFIDEPCCYNAWRYLVESGEELNLPTKYKKIRAREL